MPDELREDGGALSLHLEQDYDATPAEVWDAWTRPERLARWLARPSGELTGAPVRLDFGDGPDDWADVTVLVSEPPVLLELRWDFVGDVSSRLRVEIVELAPGRTRVRLDHSGLGDSTLGYGAGWQAYLVSLAAELGAPADGASWDERFATALPTWQARAGELAGAQRTSRATG